MSEEFSNSNAPNASGGYRGRLAPSPTGRLHLGHARTFWIAQTRARECGGALLLRNDDLDEQRCRREFVTGMFEDLRWFGLEWSEGPDCGGPNGPYSQSERRKFYVDAFDKLLAAGVIYPCRCSRKDVLEALSAPHEGEEEPVYPGTCRPERVLKPIDICDSMKPQADRSRRGLVDANGGRINWRFRTPDGESVAFNDGGFGPQHFTVGRDFGDFVLWRNDDLPAYHLAVTVDDDAMGVTEVVRGKDLLTSTARQLLVLRAMGVTPPAYFHCPLVTDEAGVRLAKRHDALSLKTLRETGADPLELTSV